MNAKDQLKLIDEKIAEQKSKVATLKTSDAISKATRSTQIAMRNKEVELLMLLKQAIDGKIDDELLIKRTTLSAERATGNALRIELGMTVLQAMQANASANKFGERFEKALAKHNWKLNDQGVIVEA